MIFLKKKVENYKSSLTRTVKFVQKCHFVRKRLCAFVTGSKFINVLFIEKNLSKLTYCQT